MMHGGRGRAVRKNIVAIMVVTALGGGVASAQQRESDDALRLRAQIVLMEGALKQAVLTGAHHLAEEVSRSLPAVDGVRVETMLVSTPQVDGFVLPQYGMMFVVRVPSMNSNISWAVPVIAGRQRVTARNSGQTGPAQVVAQTVDGGARPRDPATPTVSPVDVDALSDPVGAYRRFVKEEVTRTMLENSSALRIAPGQYLTVAARRDSPPNPLVPGDDGRSVMFTVKGSDLDAYHQKRLTLADATSRVVVEER